MYLPLMYCIKAVVCRLYEMVYPCSCNVVISCWKSGAYDLRWDRFVLRPRIWMETSRSGTVPHIGPYIRVRWRRHGGRVRSPWVRGEVRTREKGMGCGLGQREIAQGEV